MRKKLYNALCTLLICLLAFVAFGSLVGRLQNRIFFIGNRATIWVLTDSMEDTIPARSYILIEKVKDAETEIVEGDVIVFYSSDPAIAGKLNTHRVKHIDREAGCFITKGDNNQVEDSATVPYSETVAKYVKNMPVLTVIGRFLTSTVGFVIVMIAMIALVCATYLPDVIRAIQDRGEITKKTEHDREIERLIAEEVERLQKNGQDMLSQEQNKPDETDLDNTMPSSASVQDKDDPIEDQKEPQISAESDDSEYFDNNNS